MIRCLIIDDEPLAGDLLAAYAERSADLEVLGVFSNPLDALKFLGDNEVDLLFLDVQMPEISGLQLMKITNGKCDVILTTAYEEYALEGYELDVVDYLLKPIPLDRFLVAVEKAKKRRQMVDHAPAAVSATNPAATPGYIFVKSGHKTVRIDLDDIIRLESLDNYVAIYTVSSGKWLTLEKMGYFEVSLPARDFMRVHRSHLVALAKIDYIERNRIVMGEDYIPVSASYREAFAKRLE